MTSEKKYQKNNKLYFATEDGDTTQNYHERYDKKGTIFNLIKK